MSIWIFFYDFAPVIPHKSQVMSAYPCLHVHICISACPCFLSCRFACPCLTFLRFCSCHTPQVPSHVCIPMSVCPYMHFCMSMLACSCLHACMSVLACPNVRAFFTILLVPVITHKSHVMSAHPCLQVHDCISACSCFLSCMFACPCAFLHVQVCLAAFCWHVHVCMSMSPWLHLCMVSMLACSCLHACRSVLACPCLPAFLRFC